MQLLKPNRKNGRDSQAQDIAEYVVMLAVILLLVIGTVKLINGKHRVNRRGTQTSDVRPR
jgi:hypothetical protein